LRQHAFKAMRVLGTRSLGRSLSQKQPRNGLPGTWTREPAQISKYRIDSKLRETERRRVLLFAFVRSIVGIIRNDHLQGSPGRLCSHGTGLIYRILANPFIRAWWKIKSFTRLLGCHQRDSNSPLLSLFNRVFFVYLAERSFSIFGIQQIQFLIHARRMPSLCPF